MLAMDWVYVLSVLALMAASIDAGAAKVRLRYSNLEEHAETRRHADVVFESYDLFVSMLPSHPVRQFHKRQAAESNATEEVLNNHHTYYTSRHLPPGDAADGLWFELSNMIGSGAIVDDLGEETAEVLGDTHRVYQVWPLMFRFPYYGHMLDTVGVTTGGFLYTGTIFHDQIYLTQYIAPLMADFNPSLTSSGRILVYSTEERFTVQWDQVLNHDHENAGPFTFQVSIFPSGKIYFAYRKLSLLWSQLNNDDHPVEIGVADAFYYEVTSDLVYVVEYSRVSALDLLADQNTNLSYSAFVIDPVPNCVFADTCDSCMATTSLGIFNCSWCEAAEQKCSDGVDRYTQDWYQSDCIVNAVTTCPRPAEASSVPTTSVVAGGSSALPTSSVVAIVVGVSIFLLVMVVIVFVVIAVFAYGFRRPQSALGLWMIENRPKTWKRGSNSVNPSAKYELSDTLSIECK